MAFRSLCTALAVESAQAYRPSRVTANTTERFASFGWRSAARYLNRLRVSVTTMIVNTTRVIVQPEKRTEFFQTIGRLLDPMKKAKGCRTLDFYLDATDDNSTLLVSEWETEKDLDDYLRSNDFAVLRGAITILSVRSVDSKANVTSHLSKP